MSDKNDKNNLDNKDAKILNEHYDGIVEHDHPLPNWWVAIFVITVIYGVLYYGYYEIFDGPSTDQELAGELAVIKTLDVDSSGGGDAFANLDELIKDTKNIEVGKKIYAEKCFMCHGDKGQGLIGPNMTDNFWIHGDKPKDILHVIQKGVPEKGMVPWEAVLSPEEQIATVAFIKSLKGTNPAGAKASEGTEYKD
ncbi:MAG: c-type cytochrome [Bdellovibrionota bacterium]